MDRRRLFYYILLNIFVSAVVTITILFFYDRSHRLASGHLPVLSTLPAPASVSPVSDGIKVNIVSVIGAGTVASEIVVIQNNGVSPLVMTGWLLKDSQGNTYTFPQLSLNPGGTVQVHTASGVDTPVDLYWNRTDPVWAPGELATLYDDQGNTRAFYRVP
jgi:hypothetical protein